MAFFGRKAASATAYEKAALALDCAFARYSEEQKHLLVSLISELRDRLRNPEMRQIGSDFAEFGLKLLPGFLMPGRNRAYEKTLLALYERAPQLREQIVLFVGADAIEREVADAKRALNRDK